MPSSRASKGARAEARGCGMRRIFCAAFAAATLAGCAGGFVESKTADDGAVDNGYYALPRLFVTMTVTSAPQKADAAPATTTTSSMTTTKQKKAAKNAKPAPAPPKVVTVQFGAPMYVPDPDYRYMLHLDHEIWSNDHIKIDTDAAGLLTGVNADSQDQRGTAGNKVVELAAAVAQATAALGGGMIAETRPSGEVPLV
ncbi:MAG: lipoprotein, partial [Alphaproteobacteria bacterium]|nr:lipoprotein [Alphaproteobacteria bacterium]